MLLYVLIGLCVFAAIVCLGLHWLAAALFARKLRRGMNTHASANHAAWPRVSVLVCVRGVDPSLRQTLDRLAQQNYPRYDIRVVVDAMTDPAWDVVQAWRKCWPQVAIKVQPLHERLDTCSGKCSKLVQMVTRLDESVEVVALCDSDVDLDGEWLHKLVAPLLDDPRRGAVTGIRWFRPRRGGLGSTQRKLWVNLSTMSQAIGDFPWGGSLALRRTALDDSGLVDLWRNSMVDDTPIRTALQSLGLRVYATPELIVASSEECSLTFAFNFVTRQLLWHRLYEPVWPAILWHALDTFGAAAAPPFFAALAYYLGEPFWAGLALSVWLVYLVSFNALLLVLDAVVERRLSPTILQMPRPGFLARRVQAFLGVLLLPYFHIATTLRAACCRHITWRGVTYQIAGPRQVRLVRATKLELASSEHSI